MPQMILNDAYKNKKPCNIVVTQPRRIAARSIAERVSEERGWPLGSVVGYQVISYTPFKQKQTNLNQEFSIDLGWPGQTACHRRHSTSILHHRRPIGKNHRRKIIDKFYAHYFG